MNDEKQPLLTSTPSIKMSDEKQPLHTPSVKQIKMNDEKVPLRTSSVKQIKMNDEKKPLRTPSVKQIKMNDEKEPLRTPSVKQMKMSDEKQPLRTPPSIKMNDEKQPLRTPPPPIKMNDEKQPLLTPPPPGPITPTESIETLVELDVAPLLQDKPKDYNPGSERCLEHPTSNFDTLIHLLKGNIGTGILAMPDAFRNAGLYFGVFGTLFIGFMCTHCMHMLLQCSHELCMRSQKPALGFSEVIEDAFTTGPVALRPYAKKMKNIINVFLVLTQMGFCCVYFLFVATNLKDILHLFNLNMSVHVFLVLLFPPIMALAMVKNLKYLTPVSLLASIMTAWGLVITFYYILQNLPNTNTVGHFASWHQLPLYFGTAIYAFEGIGVVLPLENNMKNPEAFGGCSGVLNTGMVIVAALYTAIGFFGYLKYGEHVAGSITLNLPNTLLAVTVRVLMAMAIFLSYGLQFYVPMNIVWPFVKSRLTSEQALKHGEKVTRIILICVTFAAATIIPNLSGIISLVGAFSSSALALIFPPIIEIVTFWPDQLGKWNWKLYKDIFIIIFGITGFIFGTYTNVENLFFSK